MTKPIATVIETAKLEALLERLEELERENERLKKLITPPYPLFPEESDSSELYTYRSPIY